MQSSHFFLLKKITIILQILDFFFCNLGTFCLFNGGVETLQKKWDMWGPKALALNRHYKIANERITRSEACSSLH